METYSRFSEWPRDVATNIKHTASAIRIGRKAAIALRWPCSPSSVGKGLNHVRTSLT